MLCALKSIGSALGVENDQTHETLNLNPHRLRHYLVGAGGDGGCEVKKQFTQTWQEIAKTWDEGGIVWSAELGGIGPSYEQCIQVLLFEILSRWPKDSVSIEWDDYSPVAEKVATELDKKYGFSGAQVGQAKATAYQFIKYGYAEMMNKAEPDRLIQVRKDFP